MLHILLVKYKKNGLKNVSIFNYENLYIKKLIFKIHSKYIPHSIQTFISQTHKLFN